MSGLRGKQVLRHLETNGREAALRMIRLMLLLWITTNKDVDVVPGVSVSTWVQMEGYASLDDYVTDMRTPRTWIDTPMLVAAPGAQREGGKEG